MKRSHHSSPSTYIVIRLLWLTVLPSITALRIHTVQSLSSHTLLTSVQLPTNLTGSPIRKCVTDPTWNPIDKEIAPSCETALQTFIDETPFWGPHSGFFSYNNGRSFAKFPGVFKTLAIPRRYVSGQCVVTIVMMKMFESAEWHFPELSMDAWPQTEFATWRDLLTPIDYVRATCTNGCGYAVVGEGLGVGVVSWGLNSKWDRFARRTSLERVNGTEVDGIAIA